MGNIISVDLILEDSSHAKSIFLAFLYGLYIVFFIRTAVGIAYIVGVLTGADLSVAACSVIFLEDEAAIVDLALQTRAERGVSAEIRSAAPRFTEEFRACGANMRSYAAPVFSCSGTVRA